MVGGVVHVSYGATASQPVAVEVSERHFGTIVTSGFGWSGYGNPETSYSHTNYADPESGEFQLGSRLDFALDAIGATSIRFPGGTEVWSSFDWRQDEQVLDGAEPTDIDKLHHVIEYCAQKGLGLDFTFPARGFDGTPFDEEQQINDFFQDLLAFAQSRGVDILTIKVGNEYNVGASGGNQLAAEQYAALASDLSLIIGRALDKFSSSHSDLGVWNRPDLIIESGVIWRYGAADIGVDINADGRPDGNGIQDTFDIFSGLDPQAAQYVDGIDLHNLTLNLGMDEYLGLSASASAIEWLSQSELLAHMKARWLYYNDLDPKFGELDFHALAWSHPRTPSNPTDSTQSAAMSVLQLHTLTSAGIVSANSWLATGFVPNALVQPAVNGQAPQSGVISEAGNAMGSLSESLIGMRPIAIEFTQGTEDLTMVGFSGTDETVLFLISQSEAAQSLSLNIHDIASALTQNGGILVDVAGMSGIYDESAARSVYIQSGSSAGAELIRLELGASEMIKLTVAASEEAVFDASDFSVSVAHPFANVDGLTRWGSYEELQVGTNLVRFHRAEIIHFEDRSLTFGELIQSVEVVDFRDRNGNNVTGTAEPDEIFGTEWADVLNGLEGADTMSGGLGNDTYFVDNAFDQITGEQGYSLGGGIDTIWTTVDYMLPINTEVLRLITGGDYPATFGTGNDGPGILVGNSVDNTLNGKGGDDQINGNDGDDVLIGGVGSDILVGGQGADHFSYDSIADSRQGSGKRDVINGFEIGADLIDLSAIDAVTVNSNVNDDFKFIGFDSYQSQGMGVPGQVRLQGIGGPNGVIVEADHNGDGFADFQLLVLGVRALSESDFVL